MLGEDLRDIFAAKGEAREVITVNLVENRSKDLEW